jgi:hypothetical protein
VLHSMVGVLPAEFKTSTHLGRRDRGSGMGHPGFGLKRERPALEDRTRDKEARRITTRIVAPESREPCARLSENYPAAGSSSTQTISTTWWHSRCQRPTVMVSDSGSIGVRALSEDSSTTDYSAQPVACHCRRPRVCCW